MRCTGFRLVVVVGVAAGLAGVARPASADDAVRWQDIVGIIQAGNLVGSGTGQVAGGGQPWTARGGQAAVNLHTGHVEFNVRGLVLAGGNAIGTRGTVAQVKGTLLCDTNGSAGGGNATPVDTEPVPLSPEGDAEFSGFVVVPAACSEPDIAFLVRIAAPGTAVDGRWIANGAVRDP